MDCILWLLGISAYHLISWLLAYSPSLGKDTPTRTQTPFSLPLSLCSSPPSLLPFPAFLSTGTSLLFLAGNVRDSGKLSGRIIDSDMHDVGRFLNRLLGLPPEIQNRYAVFFWLKFNMLVLFTKWKIHCLEKDCFSWINITNETQALRVICQYPGTSHSKCAYWRSFWLWNCWYESKYHRTTRDSKG